MDDKVSGEDKKIEMDMEEIERLQREEEERLLQQRLAERSQVRHCNMCMILDGYLICVTLF